ncbi:MAG: FAD-dependent oxidoreductase, partial [Candidatus Pacebacteria bacterium]|nr:FAD-dependent oxidoreductase [Candidatus Paceibacterota bacterium]
MQHYTYVIIGGGIAGTTAAETIRKTDKEGKIAIVSDEPHTLYSRVLLSKPGWVLGEQPFDNVWLKNAEWYTENNIHLFKGLTAVELDTDQKRVTLSDGDVLAYAKLLLATGAHNRPWNVPGADKKGVHYLRTVDDAKALCEIAQGAPKHVIMIGSACVSFEIIEILHSRGFKVTEVMREKYFFEPQLSSEEVAPIERTLQEKGIEIIREAEIERVLGNGQVTGVHLADGRGIACDYILPFIGVELSVEWLKSAGIATHKGIYANQYLETNVPDVWTAGDTAENWDSALGETVIMGNWMSARLQGEVAGKNMVGPERTAFEQVSFHTSHGFGFQMGWVGDVRPLADRTIVHIPVEKPDDHCRIV